MPLVAASDASEAVREMADYRCDGKDDQKEINAAITSCGSAGGTVLLSPGRFVISGAVRLRSLVALVGSGRATVLRASGTWPDGRGSSPGAVVELADGITHRTALRHLTVDGNKDEATCKGLLYALDSYPNDRPGGPDPTFVVDDVHVIDTASVGVHLTGGTNRSGIVSRVRVFGAGDAHPAEGFLVEAFDALIVQSESGAASGDGFRVVGANNRFSDCKSWYSRRSGFNIDGVRNLLTACEAQDNARHGFLVSTGPNTLTGCHADSNSRPAAHAGPDSEVNNRYDGFHLPFSEAVQIVGCQSFDRREGGTASQRHGFFVGAGSRDCQIIGIARHNVSGGVGGEGLTAPGMNVMVTGDGRRAQG
jgi:hypothetical protein